MDKISKKFGENLKRIRLENKLSQTGLADKINADKSYISTLENGKVNPSLETLNKLAQALNIKIEDLIK